MRYKFVLRGVLAMILLIMVSSFAFDAPVIRYTPVGSWEYSVPGVQAGYESGTMTIAEDGKEYKVTMQLNEYFKADAESVVYKKKDIIFTIYVETEEILVSGSFEGDEFKGSISYSEGDFTITATRTLK
jgi:hypothetical protein